jgi:mannose-6-phosphate isomerase-like protein (cupin superfamily)
MHWPTDEFMIILQGEVVMVGQDRKTAVKRGESFHPQGPVRHLEPGGFSEENHGTVRRTYRR